MKQKFWALLLCLCVSVSSMPSQVFASEDIQSYQNEDAQSYQNEDTQSYQNEDTQSISETPLPFSIVSGTLNGTSYTTLEEAISFATSGDVVEVAKGTHEVTTLTVPPGVTLKGETGNPEDVVLQGKTSNKTVVLSTNATLEALTVTRDNTDANSIINVKVGISVPQNATGVVIDNCIVKETRTGIEAINATVTIKNSIITANRTGIQFAKNANGLVQNNIISQNRTMGILFGAVENDVAVNGYNGLTITENIFDNNWYSQVENRSNISAPVTLTENTFIPEDIEIVIASTSGEPSYDNTNGIHIARPDDLTLSKRLVTKVAGGIVVRTNVAKIGDTKYTSLAAGITEAQSGDTIELLQNVTENITLDKNITIHGGDSKKQITGHLTMKNGTLQNVTLTNVQNQKILTIGNGISNTEILMEHCNIIVPIFTETSTTFPILLTTAGNNMANITIKNSNITNSGVNADPENAKQWSYGFYITENQQSTGSFQFLNNTMKGAFRSLLGNSNGNMIVRGNQFETTVTRVLNGSTGASLGYATGIAMAGADTVAPHGEFVNNTFTNVPNQVFSYAGYHADNQAFVQVTNNTFQWTDSAFVGYIQLWKDGGLLDLSTNTFVYGENFPNETAVAIYGNILMAENVLFFQDSLYQKMVNGQKRYVAFDDTTLSQALLASSLSESQIIEILTGTYSNKELQIPAGAIIPALPTPTIDAPSDKAFVGWSDGKILYSKVNPAFAIATTLTPVWSSTANPPVTGNDDTSVAEVSTPIQVTLPTTATDEQKNIASELANRTEIIANGLAEATLKQSDNVSTGENKVFLDVQIVNVAVSDTSDFSQVVYEIKPYMLNNITGVPEIIHELTGNSTNKQPITIKLPIATVVDSHFAKVVHSSDDGSQKGVYILPIEKVSDKAYVNLSITSFSTFAISFTSAFDIIATADNGGSITPEGTIYVETGENQTFSITPDTGYQIKNVLVDGESKGKLASYTFTNVNEPHTISATFEASSGNNGGSGGSSGSSSSITFHTITAIANDGGTISESGTISVRSGASKTFTFTPNAGYEIVEVWVNGKNIGAVSSYVFTNVRSNQTINVVFKSTSGNVKPQVDVAFDDVSENHWFFDCVYRAVNKGFFAGTGDNKFSPNMPTTRGMIATVIYRMEKEPNVDNKSVFEDVLSNNWFYNGVTWAQFNGIVKGYGNGNFGPNDSITREQMAVILFNYGEFKGYDTSKSASLVNFVDSNQTSDYAVSAMQWAVGTGLISGKENNILDPKGVATRAEVAAILIRFEEIFSNK